jgi:hypothetical protein
VKCVFAWPKLQPEWSIESEAEREQPEVEDTEDHSSPCGSPRVLSTGHGAHYEQGSSPADV